MWRKIVLPYQANCGAKRDFLIPVLIMVEALSNMIVKGTSLTIHGLESSPNLATANMGTMPFQILILQDIFGLLNC